ncbi:hypothetical protein ACFWUP_00665 [Nocardia sp. NPDC058658]
MIQYPAVGDLPMRALLETDGEWIEIFTPVDEHRRRVHAVG